MHEHDGQPGDDTAQPKLVNCRRTGQDYDVGQHARCPYCWGSDERIAGGKHEEFCDFQPGRDPVNFGFPEDGTRQRHA